MTELTITKENISSVLESDKPVLLDFYASWCGPCRKLLPVIDEVAEELKDQVVVGKIDVDENMELAGKYGVSTIPTLMVFKNGKPVNLSIGYMPKTGVLEMLKAV